MHGLVRLLLLIRVDLLLEVDSMLLSSVPCCFLVYMVICHNFEKKSKTNCILSVFGQCLVILVIGNLVCSFA